MRREKPTDASCGMQCNIPSAFLRLNSRHGHTRTYVCPHHSPMIGPTMQPIAIAYRVSSGGTSTSRSLPPSSVSCPPLPCASGLPGDAPPPPPPPPLLAPALAFAARRDMPLCWVSRVWKLQANRCAVLAWAWRPCWLPKSCPTGPLRCQRACKELGSAA
jgi:hypothetical protein